MGREQPSSDGECDPGKGAVGGGGASSAPAERWGLARRLLCMGTSTAARSRQTPRCHRLMRQEHAEGVIFYSPTILG